MARPALKARICRLLATLSPLTVPQLQSALNDPGREEILRYSTVCASVYRLRGLGVVRDVPCPAFQIRRTTRSTRRAWELAP